MENSDKMARIKAMQNQVREIQNSLIDTTLSEGGDLQITMDGNVQILEIKWLMSISDQAMQTEILVKTINRAILNINLKLKDALQQIAQSSSFPNP